MDVGTHSRSDLINDLTDEDVAKMTFSRLVQSLEVQASECASCEDALKRLEAAFRACLEIERKRGNL